MVMQAWLGFVKGLVTNYGEEGGLRNGRGFGHMKFYPS